MLKTYDLKYKSLDWNQFRDIIHPKGATFLLMELI